MGGLLAHELRGATKVGVHRLPRNTHELCHMYVGAGDLFVDSLDVQVYAVLDNGVILQGLHHELAGLLLGDGVVVVGGCLVAQLAFDDVTVRDFAVFVVAVCNPAHGDVVLTVHGVFTLQGLVCPVHLGADKGHDVATFEVEILEGVQGGLGGDRQAVTIEVCGGVQIVADLDQLPLGDGLDVVHVAAQEFGTCGLAAHLVKTDKGLVVVGSEGLRVVLYVCHDRCLLEFCLTSTHMRYERFEKGLRNGIRECPFFEIGVFELKTAI